MKGKQKWRLVLAAGMIFVLLNVFVATFGITKGRSMNIAEYSVIVKYKLPVTLRKLNAEYEFPLKRGEIVSFWKEGHGNIAKRVVGLPGEKISYRQGNLYIEDALVAEPYLKPNQKDQSNLPSFRLQKDEIWVMGDNRIDSYDSRRFGPLKINEIRGKIFLFHAEGGE
ncbi:signal peptidase I [uncultured Dubosiella sp.]|uniref:signal peptidase I n=1 Tax=uncultured Dubosiella sp. TaxID=1937011 RepID=UPI0025B5C169|nr:signal peptidase I [uncultured Dubosiella sp.]